MMKTNGILFLGLMCGVASGLAGPAEDRIGHAVADYADRLQKASEELSSERDRVVRERREMFKVLREAEDRVAAIERENAQLEAAMEKIQDARRQTVQDYEPLKRNLSYLGTLIRDSYATVRDGFAPGEDQLFRADVDRLRLRPEEAAEGVSALSTQVAEFLFQRIVAGVEGRSFSGNAVQVSDNEVVQGTFVPAGSETYFRPEGGLVAGVVRNKEGAIYPLFYPLKYWNDAEAEAFMSGRKGSVMADPSGGKALVLEETKGTVWQHIQKGGFVSYAILGAGVLSIALMLSKVWDLFRFRVESPSKIHEVLGRLREVPLSETVKRVEGLRKSTRELLEAGLQSLSQPKAVIEEHMWAVLLRQRLHFERRLSLLAVIAVAAPLMGLLGTVSGMVRTFALITVFGTGNAGKLAGGISEVLVATELGLVVAIPTLVIHGILSNRIQKRLALQERFALEFSTAAQLRAAEESVEESAA